MSGKPLGNRLRADQAARLEQYRAARTEGLSTFEAADRVGIKTATRQAYERWYRRELGLPDRESVPNREIAQNASDPGWRLP